MWSTHKNKVFVIVYASLNKEQWHGVTILLTNFPGTAQVHFLVKNNKD